MLQNNGPEINNEGWTVILNILQEISYDGNKFKFNTANSAFKCLEVLVNQYLHVVDFSKLSFILNIIENFNKMLGIIFNLALNFYLSIKLIKFVNIKLNFKI